MSQITANQKCVQFSLATRCTDEVRKTKNTTCTFTIFAMRLHIMLGYLLFETSGICHIIINVSQLTVSLMPLDVLNIPKCSTRGLCRIRVLHHKRSQTLQMCFSPQRCLRLCARIIGSGGILCIYSKGNTMTFTEKLLLNGKSVNKLVWERRNGVIACDYLVER